MNIEFVMMTAMGLLLTSFTGCSAMTPTLEGLPDVRNYGYKNVYHMGAVVKHMEKFGFNTFTNPYG